MLLLAWAAAAAVVAVAAAAAAQWLGWLLARRRQLPGPIPLPLLGNLLHLLLSQSPHRTLTNLAHNYGPLFSLQLGVLRFVIASTPAAAQQILNANDKSLASRPPNKSVERLMYGSVQHVSFMSPYGETWRLNRKIYTSHMFNARLLQEAHLPIVAEEIRSAILGRVFASSRSGEPVNLTNLLSCHTQNIMYRIVLGKLPTEISKTATAVEALYQHIHEIERLVSLNRIGDFIPFLGFLDYGTNRGLDRRREAMDAILEGVIAERQQQKEAKPTTEHSPAEDPFVKGDGQRSMVDTMLASDPPMDRVKMKAMLIELIVSGTKSSGTALDWIMAELLSNERVMRKAVAELDEVVGKGRMVAVDDLRDAEKLPYLRAVVKEALRLHPPVPLMLPHMASEACDVITKVNAEAGEASYRIAAGTRILVNAWAIGRDEEAWGPTAATFVPERFMRVDGDGKVNGVNTRGQHFELLPFGSGRRMCPGLNIASAVLELTIASIIHAFDWTVTTPVIDMTETFGLTLPRRYDLLAVPSSFRLHPHLAINK